MTLISRPMLAPVISGTSTTPDHGVRRPEGIVRVRRTAQAVQEAPEAADPTEDTPDAAEAAQDATDTAPATRADVARLEGLVLQLLARDEERAATIARLEDVALSVLLDLDTLRQRVESWRAEDAERADY
ncbi:hypothetical protein [Geodermatophilus obscurus]|nr:hypothetical protein [Geodermatophilus obscurus]